MVKFVSTKILCDDGEKRIVYYLGEEAKQSLEKCPVYQDMVENLIRAIEILKDCLHQQLVNYFEEKIIKVLKLKSWRLDDLEKAVSHYIFWKQFHVAFENLEKSGKISFKHGWIKLKESEEA